MKSFIKSMLFLIPPVKKKFVENVKLRIENNLLINNQSFQNAGDNPIFLIVEKPSGQMLPITHSNQHFEQVFVDTTNYCNARCKFCFNKWEDTNINMSREIFEKVIQVLPLTKASKFMFSCQFEPTLNPLFVELLETIPAKYKSKVWFTTNLVKHIPDEMLHRLAKTEISYVNISLETFNEKLYTGLTGAGQSHFFDNLNRLAEVFSQYPFAPKLIFTTMILKDNREELVSLAKTVNDKYNPVHHQLRSPFLNAEINENTEYLQYIKNQLFSREELAEIVNELKALGLDILTFDIQGDLELFTQLIDTQSKSDTPAVVNANSAETDNFLIYSKASHYDVRITADGTGIFRGIPEEFNLAKIDNPLLFFSNKLFELQELEAKLYEKCDQTIMINRHEVEDLSASLEEIYINDTYFMFLHGLVKSNRENIYISVNKQALYRTRTDERYCNSSAQGFMCCIDLRKIKFDKNNPIKIDVGVYDNNVLKTTLLAEIPFNLS